MNEPDSPAEAEIELARFRDAAGVEDCSTVLKAAGIEFRVSSDVPAFDISAVGTGGANGSVIIMVASEDEQRARQALLDDARQQIRGEVAPDYHLHEWADEELVDLLAEPMEWSAYDVAAAEAILTKRGVAFQPPSYKLTPQVIQEREEKQLRFKLINRAFIIHSVIGLGFLVSLGVLSQREDPEGKDLFHWVRVGGVVWMAWLLLFKKGSSDDD